MHDKDISLQMYICFKASLKNLTAQWCQHVLMLSKWSLKYMMTAAAMLLVFHNVNSDFDEGFTQAEM